VEGIRDMGALSDRSLW